MNGAAHLVASNAEMLAALKNIGAVLSRRPATIKDDELWAAFSQVVGAIARASEPSPTQQGE